MIEKIARWPLRDHRVVLSFHSGSGQIAKRTAQPIEQSYQLHRQHRKPKRTDQERNDKQDHAVLYGACQQDEDRQDSDHPACDSKGKG